MKNALRGIAATTVIGVGSIGLLAGPAVADGGEKSERKTAAIQVDGAYTAGDTTQAVPLPGAVVEHLVLKWCEDVGGEIGVAMCNVLIARP